MSDEPPGGYRIPKTLMRRSGCCSPIDSFPAKLARHLQPAAAEFIDEKTYTGKPAINAGQRRSVDASKEQLSFILYPKLLLTRKLCSTTFHSDRIARSDPQHYRRFQNRNVVPQLHHSRLASSGSKKVGRDRLPVGTSSSTALAARVRSTMVRVVAPFDARVETSARLLFVVRIITQKESSRGIFRDGGRVGYCRPCTCNISECALMRALCGLAGISTFALSLAAPLPRQLSGHKSSGCG